MIAKEWLRLCLMYPILYLWNTTKKKTSTKFSDFGGTSVHLATLPCDECFLTKQSFTFFVINRTGLHHFTFIHMHIWIHEDWLWNDRLNWKCFIFSIAQNIAQNRECAKNFNNLILNNMLCSLYFYEQWACVFFCIKSEKI